LGVYERQREKIIRGQIFQNEELEELHFLSNIINVTRVQAIEKTLGVAV
jgi:hypothetical protein